MNNDLISREAIRSKIWKERVEKDEGCNSEYIRGLKTAIGFIDNAQAVPLPKAPESEAESLDYQRAVEDTEYCERHEPTYNPDDGSM